MVVHQLHTLGWRRSNSWWEGLRLSLAQPADAILADSVAAYTGRDTGGQRMTKYDSPIQWRYLLSSKISTKICWVCKDLLLFTILVLVCKQFLSFYAWNRSLWWSHNNARIPEKLLSAVIPNYWTNEFFWIRKNEELCLYSFYSRVIFVLAIIDKRYSTRYISSDFILYFL